MGANVLSSILLPYTPSTNNLFRLIHPPTWQSALCHCWSLLFHHHTWGKTVKTWLVISAAQTIQPSHIPSNVTLWQGSTINRNIIQNCNMAGATCFCLIKCVPTDHYKALWCLRDALAYTSYSPGTGFRKQVQHTLSLILNFEYTQPEYQPVPEQLIKISSTNIKYVNSKLSVCMRVIHSGAQIRWLTTARGTDRAEPPF